MKKLFPRQSLLNFADGVDLAAVPDNPITKAILDFRHVLIHLQDSPSAEIVHKQFSDLLHKNAKLKMRKGKIKRPPGAKEPIIRLVGNAEAHLIHDEEQVSIPNTRKDWDEILYSMFQRMRGHPAPDRWGCIERGEITEPT